MWQLDNRTPFAAAQSWIRDRSGAETWLVALKATFEVRVDGSLQPAREQAPVLRTPVYTGEAGASSLLYEADFPLAKTTTDVILVGKAHAPPGRAVTQLDVGLRVGTIVKSLRVFGDRTWERLGPGKPQAFIEMPLVYERAFGGAEQPAGGPAARWDVRNPVGCGFGGRGVPPASNAVPNIEYPDELLHSWRDRPRPAGFGAIASHWQPRASYAGTYGANWARDRQPLLPEDFDERFHQCAPEDQWPAEFLRGGEPVTLVGVSPVADRLSFALPAMEPVLETRFLDGERREHDPPRLHTVIFMPEVSRCCMVWFSALQCHDKVYKLQKTRIEIRAQADREDPPVEELLDLV